MVSAGRLHHKAAPALAPAQHTTVIVSRSWMSRSGTRLGTRALEYEIVASTRHQRLRLRNPFPGCSLSEAHLRHALSLACPRANSLGVPGLPVSPAHLAVERAHLLPVHGPLLLALLPLLFFVRPRLRAKYEWSGTIFVESGS